MSSRKSPNEGPGQGLSPDEDEGQAWKRLCDYVENHPDFDRGQKAVIASFLADNECLIDFTEDQIEPLKESVEMIEKECTRRREVLGRDWRELTESVKRLQKNMEELQSEMASKTTSSKDLSSKL